jgi:hypothetical protein
MEFNELDKLSNRNLILFYAEELRQIHKGENRLCEVLGRTLRKRMIEFGIIDDSEYFSPKLTETAEQILKNNGYI